MLLLVENCPHISCRGEVGKVFFEEKGLAQHFRAKHVRVFFDEEKFTREVWRLFKFFFTAKKPAKEHQERLTTERGLQVCCQYVFCFRYNAYILRFNSQ